MNSFQEGTDGTKYVQKRSLAFQSDKISLSSSSSSEYKNSRSCVDQDQINPDDSKDLPSSNSSKTSSRIKECIQQSISAESKKTISSILNEVNQLSDLEKLLLYLQLPTGAPANVDPLKQKSPGNPLGKKADIAVAQTYTWIQSHLEEDPEVSLPKQEIYEEYKLFCDANKIEGLCAADFGKVMKYVFPSVKPRRLGTRGNSRYCYSGLRKKLSVETPALPDITIELESLQDGKNAVVNDELSSAASYLIFEWAEKLLNKKFESLSDLASHLVENLYVDTRSVAAFAVLSSSNNQPVGKGSQSNLLQKSSTNKRRETQLHLQRKLQEKELIREQKKKLQLLSKNCKTGNGCRKSGKKDSHSGARSKESTAITLDAKPDATADKLNSSIVDQVVKKEEKDKTAVNSSTSGTLSPIKPIRSYSEGSIALEQELNNRPKKIPINRKTSSPGACFSQTVPSIIVLSSLSQVDIDVKNCSPVQKPSSQKYKRIQPKPSQYPSTSIAIPSQSLLNIENGVEKPICGYSLELAEANGLAALQDTNGKTPPGSKAPEITEKSNVEILKTISAALASTTQTRNVCQSDSTIHRKSFAFGSSHNESPIVVKKGKKGPSLAKESKSKISNGKRCLEDTKSSRPFKKPLIESASCQNNENFPSKNESQNVNAKRLPDVQIESSLMNKNITLDNLDRGSIDEVSIQQIETDALMEEYLHGNHDSILEKDINKSSFDKMANLKIELEGSKQIIPTSKAQLSQLRLLLQRNLPQPSLSRSVVTKPTTAVSEENSILDGFTGFVTGLTDLRSNGNRHSSFRSQSEPSSFFFNFNGHCVDEIEPSLQLGESILRENPKLQNDMEESQALQDSKLFNSTLEFHNSDFSICGDTALSDDQALTLPTLTTKSESGLEFGLNRSFDDANNDVSSLDKSNILSYTSSFTPSVPPSPNTRRRAFNFMPISPRQTPIPDNLGFSNAGGSSALSSASPLQMFVPANNGANISASVGPSQPPSTASSPFVSPRGTPVPISRSRHNSGQSAYSTPRQTPSQNFVDSGVSSISTSPFVSPQTTPVPVSRLRHNSNHGGTGKTVTFSTAVAQGGMQNGLSFQCRSRHNSGPLPPPPSLAASCSTSSSGGIISYFMSPRSAPLSPLVGENFTQTNFNFPTTNVESNGKVRSRHSSASSLNIPMSPLSSPVSPSSHLIGNSDPLVGASDTSSKTNGLNKKFGLLQNDEGRNVWNAANRLPSMASLKNNSQFSWPSISEGQFCPPSSASTLRKRNRHVSGSVIHHRPSNHDPFVQELQSFLQSDSPSSPNPIADSISRSRSVPLQQMLLLEQLNNSISSSGTIDASGNFNFNNSTNTGGSKDLFDRSYQSTPIQDSFQLVEDQGGPSNLHEENLTSSPFVGNSGNFSEENSRKEQDLGVSQSSGLSSWANPLENLSSRRNINELLEGDILQSTLEDLRDFDNDFSKFAEELEQMDQSKEPDF